MWNTSPTYYCSLIFWRASSFPFVELFVGCWERSQPRRWSCVCGGREKYKKISPDTFLVREKQYLYVLLWIKALDIACYTVQYMKEECTILMCYVLSTWIRGLQRKDISFMFFSEKCGTRGGGMLGSLTFITGLRIESGVINCQGHGERV